MRVHSRVESNSFSSVSSSGEISHFFKSGSVLVTLTPSSPEFDLRQADSGKETLEWLKENEFALILTEVHMHEMKRYETTGGIRDIPNHGYVPNLQVEPTPGEIFSITVADKLHIDVYCHDA